MAFDRSVLAPMDIPRRAAHLRAGLDDAGCTALLVTNVVNVRYLTGFSGSAALALVSQDGLTFVTDGRYQEQAAAELAAAGVEARIEIARTADEQRDALRDCVAAASVSRLGLEAENVTWAQQRRIKRKWLPDHKLVPTVGLIEALRMVKDEGEIARIETACAIADAALAAVRHRLGEGPTEAEVALELEWQMRRLGAEAASFDTIVASGPNGSRPHHRAGERRIAEGDLVVIDFGALIDGYHSDMTRTTMVGTPSDTQARMWQVVHDAQAAGVGAVKPGADVKGVDEACRSVIREAGWGDAFLHGTGHGVGLDIHESPRISWSADATLADGHVVTVEPGVYIADAGGVRIEDTVVVTPDGCRALTRAPKQRDL